MGDLRVIIEFSSINVDDIYSIIIVFKDKIWFDRLSDEFARWIIFE